MDKQTLAAQQISSRVGELEVTLDGDRVKLTGSCAFYMQGRISLPD